MSETQKGETENTVFRYPFTIPETQVEIRVKKEQITDLIEDILQRPLTQEEKDHVWDEAKNTLAWYDTFPSYAARSGIHMYGRSDSEFFHECFKPGLQHFVDETMNDLIEPLFRYPFEDYIRDGLLELEAGSELASEGDEQEDSTEQTPITLENIEHQTQKRIQDENVKNGLARCANETKRKSIAKWKAWYFSKQKNKSSPLTKPQFKQKPELSEYSYFS